MNCDHTLRLKKLDNIFKRRINIAKYYYGNDIIQKLDIEFYDKITNIINNIISYEDVNIIYYDDCDKLYRKSNNYLRRIINDKIIMMNKKYDYRTTDDNDFIEQEMTNI
jgi:hypothetical protein